MLIKINATGTIEKVCWEAGKLFLVIILQINVLKYNKYLSSIYVCNVFRVIEDEYSYKSLKMLFKHSEK